MTPDTAANVQKRLIKKKMFHQKCDSPYHALQLTVFCDSHYTLVQGFSRAKYHQRSFGMESSSLNVTKAKPPPAKTIRKEKTTKSGGIVHGFQLTVIRLRL